MSVIPAENTLTKCRSCGARIFFARTANAKDMPLDAKPTRMITVDPLGPGERQHKVRWVETFTPHHATCPDAGKWRRE